jgi:penicillin amidase
LRRTLAALGVVVGVAVLLAVVVSTAGSAWLVHRSFPQTAGTLTVAGLDDSVRVVRNAYGVPDIYATDPHDLFFAQGYVHAQDRFWEMDVRRHITSGRLSEMFGSSQVDTDKFVRTLGWYRTAQQELALMSPQTRDALQAYSDGVNAYLADHSGAAVSLEYAILKLTNRGYHIEPWTPVDSLSWLKAMAWDLRTNVEDEIYRSIAAAQVGRARAMQLYPPYPYAQHQPIVTQGTLQSGRFTTRSGRQPTAQELGAPATSALRATAHGMTGLDRWLGAYRPGIGSNSWAVNGPRSATGGALLANDPHLEPSLPGIWYQMGLHCVPRGNGPFASCPYDVSGFTFSGVPGVIIGHNDHIAWGFTNLGPDVSDLSLEKVTGDTYLQDGRQVPLVTRQETIRVAGGTPVTFTVRSTDDGPIVSDVSDNQRAVGRDAPVPASAPARGDGYAVSMQWTALQPGTTGDAILRIDRAADWHQFRAAARRFQVPSQNMLYADTRGNIGYQAPGKIPIRAKGDGTFPVPGWDSSYRWTGYIPFRALPYAFNPPSHLIATANNAVIGLGYPYLLTKDWDYGYRSQRIVDVLRSSPPMTVDSMQHLQFDSRNPMAPTLVPYLMRVCRTMAASATQAAKAGCRQLATWDFTQPDTGAMSAPAAFYNEVWRALLADTFDELSGDARPAGADRWMMVMTRLLARPHDPWWDVAKTSDQTETRDAVLQQAIADGAAALAEEQGSDPAGWSWGRLHTLDLRSPTFGESGIAPLEALFNRGPIETSGGEAEVNATSWTAYAGFQVDQMPSMRMVVDLNHLNGSRWVNLTGQSGHVFDPHYWDQTPLWVTGRTLPWAFTPQAVSAAADQILTLDPPS